MWNVKGRMQDRKTECSGGGVNRFIEQTIPLGNLAFIVRAVKNIPKNCCIEKTDLHD